MGRLDLKGIGTFGRSAHTAASYDRDATVEEVAATLSSLSASDALRQGLMTCLLFGMGAQPRSVFRSLERQAGLSVLFLRSLLPGALAFLRPVVASYEGAIRINDAAAIKPAFSALMDRSMVGLYCFEPSREQRVIAEMKQPRGQFDFGLAEDPSYFFYVVDADNAESKTGIHEIVSYGKATPDSLVPPRLRV
jgi:hypothetical protein